MHEDYSRFCAFIQARNYGKTELARQSAKDYLNKIYGNPALKFKNGNYIDYDIDLTANSDLINQIIKEEEKNKMANVDTIYTFTTKDFKGDRYEITIEKSFKNNAYPYHVRLYSLNNIGGAIFIRTFGYRFWEQLETQLMYDLAGNDGIVVCKDCRDEVTCELERARHKFGGLSYEDLITPRYENTDLKRQIDNLYKPPFEAMPKIKMVIFNNPATIVFWRDGSKTIVKMNGKDKKFDPEKGLAMAIAKKYLGNEGNYYNTFTKFLPEEKDVKKSAKK